MNVLPGRRILRIKLERRPVLSLRRDPIVAQLVDYSHEIVGFSPDPLGLDCR